MNGRASAPSPPATDAEHDVLLVDDDALVRTIAVRRLRDSGLTLKTCASGAEALDYLGQARVRLLLVDFRMQPMDGIEFLEKLHAQGCCESTRIYVATSAMPEPGVRKRLEQLGAGLLMKADAVAAGGIARLLDGPPPNDLSDVENAA